MKTTRSAHPVHPKIGVIGVQTILAAILGLAMIFTLSCDAANNPSALAGRWVVVSGDGKGVVMELLSDGTGVLTEGSKGVAITWKTEDGRFYITTLGIAIVQSYKLQGSLLTFTDDKGKTSGYAKCLKDCQEVAKEYAKAEEEKAAAALKAKLAEVKKGSFIDSRDGKSYKTVKLNNQTWMAENLDYNAKGSKCYDDKPDNCQKYSRLYNWKTALNTCPKGWHLPSDAEWQTLVDFAGGSEAGNILKASVGWAKDGNGVDAAGFSALPGGLGSSNGGFGSVGKYGFWWSATERDASRTYIREMLCSNANVDRVSLDKTALFSVRCVQD